MDECKAKLIAALEQVKRKHCITRLQTDRTGQIEVMYLLPSPNAYSFRTKEFLDMHGINDVGHNFKYNQDFMTRLVVDDDGKTIDILEDASEEDALRAVMSRCSLGHDIYILHGRRGSNQKELLFSKGTTLEQLVIENELIEHLS